MRPSNPSSIQSSFFRGIFVAAMLLVAAVPGFARRNAVVASTGKVLDRQNVWKAMPTARMGTNTYAEVNSEWLKKFYSEYRSELSRLGVVNWNERYDCRRFVGLYTELAQSRYFVQTFHNNDAAQSLAIGQIWYQRDSGAGAHAVVMAITERGRVFIEPQTGEELRLSQKEISSIFFSVI